MSYLWIALIGAITGGLTGLFVTGSRQHVVVDLIAGAIGAWVFAVVCRAVVPDVANTAVLTSIVAVAGAIVALLAMSRFMRPIVGGASRTRRL